jgi:TetR/AcrR family transcriptional regulator
MPYPRFENMDPDKKKRILCTSLEEFASNDVQQASLNQITKKAGLSAGALYYYFENKEDLFETVVRDAVQQFWMQLGDIPTLIQTAEYWQVIKQMVLARFRFTLENPIHAKLVNKLFDSQFSGEDNSVEHLIRDEIQQYIQRIFQVGIQRGEIRQDLPADLLFNVMINYIFAINQWFARKWDRFQDVPLDESEIQEIVSKVLGMLRGMLHPSAQTNQI